MAIDPDSALAVQPELLSGERLLWAGRPTDRFVLRSQDAFLIPFSLLWGGFAIVWELLAGGLVHGSTSHHEGQFFFALWGAPFVLIGQYMIWGRFIVDSYLRKRTYYAVTDRRVLVVQNGWRRRMTSAYVNTLPAIVREGGRGRCGTLRFGPSSPMWQNQGWAVWSSMAVADIPVFQNIEDLDEVYRLVSDLREKSTGTARAF